MRGNKLLSYAVLMTVGLLHLSGLSALNLQLSKNRQKLVQEVNKAIQAGDFEKASEGIEQFRKANQKYLVRELSNKLVTARMAAAKEAAAPAPAPDAPAPAAPAPDAPAPDAPAPAAPAPAAPAPAAPAPAAPAPAAPAPAAPAPAESVGRNALLETIRAQQEKKEKDIKDYFATLLGDKKEAADAISIDDLMVLHGMFRDIDKLADDENTYNSGIVFDNYQYFFKMGARDKGADITSKIATLRKSKNLQGLLEALKTELEKVAPGTLRRGLVALPGADLSKEQSKAMGKLNTVRDLLRLLKGESDLALPPEVGPESDDDEMDWSTDDEPQAEPKLEREAEPEAKESEPEMDTGIGSPFE